MWDTYIGIGKESVFKSYYGDHLILLNCIPDGQDTWRRFSPSSLESICLDHVTNQTSLSLLQVKSKGTTDVFGFRQFYVYGLCFFILRVFYFKTLIWPNNVSAWPQRPKCAKSSIKPNSPPPLNPSNHSQKNTELHTWDLSKYNDLYC